MNADISGLRVEVDFQYNVQPNELEHGGLDLTALPSPEQWQEWLCRWLVELQPSYSPIDAYEVSLCLTTDEVVQQLNRNYRQQDHPTDVLAFAVLDGDRPPADVLTAIPFPLGDIVISLETAQRQAAIHQHSLTTELAWLTAHGLLHLLGWDHPDDDHLVQMLNQQDVLLTAIQLSAPDSIAAQSLH